MIPATGHVVFISHSSKDKAFADAVCTALEVRGVRCWVALRDLLPGATWAKSILKAIADSRLMVLIFSRHIQESQHVCREVERAVHHGIAIAPIRVHDVMPAEDLEYYLSTSHWMDATGPVFANHLDEMADKVQALLAMPPRPTTNLPPTAPPVPPPPFDPSPGPRIAPGRPAGPLTERASLRLTSNSGTCNFVLLGLPQVKMGRGRAGNDLVLRVLPRSDPNDVLSLHITGKGPHLTLSLLPTGLVIEDHGSANGTELDGKRVRGRAVVPLDRPSNLNVAGALFLRLQPFGDDDAGPGDPAGPTGGMARLTEATSAEPDALWRLAERWRLRSLLIHRVSNLAADEKYLLVYRWARVGPGISNELPLGPGCDPRPGGRVLRLAGTFWWDAPGDSCVSVEGEPQRQSLDRIPFRLLTAGTKLSCGSTSLEFGDQRQVGV